MKHPPRSGILESPFAGNNWFAVSAVPVLIERKHDVVLTEHLSWGESTHIRLAHVMSPVSAVSYMSLTISHDRFGKVRATQAQCHPMSPYLWCCFCTHPKQTTIKIHLTSSGVYQQLNINVYNA